MKDLQGDGTAQPARTMKANGAEELERNNEITRPALQGPRSALCHGGKYLAVNRHSAQM